MSNLLEFKNRPVWMEGDYTVRPIFLKNARVTEGLSEIAEIKIEFLSSKRDIDIHSFMGKKMSVVIKDESDTERSFSGTCISVEYIGLYQGMSHFVAEVRPWLWFLTRTMENRIFQEKSVVDIIQEILSDYGFSSSLQLEVSETYQPRTYCVQYRETDFDFISRLMEEEGLYYFFKFSSEVEKMVLADGISAHQALPDFATIPFHYRDGNYRRADDHIFEWNEAENFTTGKVTLDDYDFERPGADKKKVKLVPKGARKQKPYEHYRYPGHLVMDGTDADRVTRVNMESLAVRREMSRGVCNVRTMSVGHTFKLEDHPRPENNIEHLIVRAVHHLQIDTDYEDDDGKQTLIDNRLPVDENNTDTYRCFFDVIPKTIPFRAPRATPWPEIAGLQTAVVTGPAGEEIHTDQYGRIKVQFHWDRLGQKDDKTSCWVRCVMPWTGKNWGMISVPRIGQEVAIQFEEGDPDRPICTGMLYNAATMPPYKLPDNMTQTGIKTRSTKSGGANNFNELVFEDKKGEEFVRLQSEKDFTQIIKNNANVFIGLQKKDKGDLTQIIHRHKVETLNTGNHLFHVKDGNQTIKVKKNLTEVVEGKSTQTITGNTTQIVKTGNFAQNIKAGNFTQMVKTGNYSQTVKTGNVTEKVSMGNVTRKVGMGNEKHTLSLGNFERKASLGAIKEQAMQKIEFKVGGSSIKIDQMGVTIKGLMVKIEGTAMLQTKAPLSINKGTGLLILKGGVTLIN